MIALRFIWAFISPLFGPIVMALRGWLPGLNVAGVIMPTIALVGVVIICWQGYRLWQRGPVSPDVVTVDHVRANRLAAENAALKKALADRQATLDARERELAAERDGLASRLEMMERARAASRETNITFDHPVLDASDPWMRSKR